MTKRAVSTAQKVAWS
jgi:hypothetical protein